MPDLLAHGDNLALMRSLHGGPLAAMAAAHGGIKLVYMDPPFAVGNKFTMPLPDGRHAAVAYSDRWQNGLCGFLSMLHTRLTLLRALLAPGASLVLHCDWRSAPHLRLILDEIFGPERFLGDIAWRYTGGGRARRWFSRKHDRLLHYALSDAWTFHADAVRLPYKQGSGYAKSGITSRSGKKYLPHPEGSPADDVWDIPMVNPLAKERCGYPTQKPLPLMERIILALSDPGDLTADFFCGSGSFPLAARRLGRRWLAADSSPLAVHYTRQRLLAEPNPGPGFVLASVREDNATPARAFPLVGRLAQGDFAYGLEPIRATLLPGPDQTFKVRLDSLSPRAHDPHGPAASLLALDWPHWLVAWSVGLPLGPGRPPSLILWQSPPREPSPGLALESPWLALGPGSGYTWPDMPLLLRLTDMFGNTCHAPLTPLP